MNLRKVDVVLHYELEIEENNNVFLYRRNTGIEPEWEILLGESWETILYDYEELEEIFKEWQQKQNTL